MTVSVRGVGARLRARRPEDSPVPHGVRRGYGVLASTVLGVLLLAIIGGAVAIGVSSDLRNKVLDLLFGAEEEFDYTSTTAPSTSAPSQPQAAGTT